MTDSTSWRDAEWTRPHTEIEGLVAIAVRGGRFKDPDTFLNEYPYLLKVPKLIRHLTIIKTAASKARATSSKTKNTEVEVVDKHIRQLRQNHQFLTMNDTLWIFDTQQHIWTADNTPEALISDVVAKDLHGKEKYKSRIIAEVIHGIKDLSHHPGVELGGPPNIIICANGRLDINTGIMFPDFPENEYQITSIPIVYDPKATCPNFSRFITEVMTSEEDRSAIIEFFGYCLYKSYPYAIIPLLVGSGANGKSTLLNVLRAMLGDKNVTASTIQDLTDNRFATAALHGKLANICSEQPSAAVRNSDRIKALTGNDMIRAERKGRDEFMFKNYAKLIFSANQVPSSSDDSAAYYRRFRIIDFPNTFDINDPKTDPHVIDKMTTPQELSGVLNLAIDGWRWMQHQGHLTGEQSMSDKRMDYIKRSNSAQFFALNFVEQYNKGDTHISVNTMYDWYVSVCHKLLNTIPIGQKRFTHELKRYLPFAEVEQERVGTEFKYLWYGCTVRLDKIAEMESQKGVC